MSNRNFDAARTYHEATKHSEISIRASAHYLDWDNKPSPFKEYRNLPSIALPRIFPHPGATALEAIRSDLKIGDKQLDLGVLAELLFFSDGLTRRMRFGRETYYMRAASATGALYPIETYAVPTRVVGLDPGVYHFDPLHFSLVSLRKGDYRGVLSDAGSPDSLSAPLTLALTSLAWRNSWKYESRSYRHWFWDSGVIAANLLATANSEGLLAKIELGFVDTAIDNLLALQPKKEATVALAVIGESKQSESSGLSSTVPNLNLEVNPLSKDEVDYPIIWETNEASQLKTRPDVEAWRNRVPEKPEDLIDAPAFALSRKTPDSVPTLDKVILQRGSTRRFAHQSISFESLSTILETSSTDISLDFLSDDQSLIDFYFTANDVQGLTSGSYFYNQKTNSVEQLKKVESRSMSGYLCLGQQLFNDASVVFFLMTNLDQVLPSLGNRGYRAAQFEAGVRAGKIYLTSYALGIGASGSTFFDDAVTEFFSPHAEGKSPMIAVGVGVPGYEARPGKVLPQLARKD